MRVLETEEEYVTNAKELADLAHSLGLNTRHFGLVLKQVHQNWLRSMLLTEIGVRCMKQFYRFDMQNCILNQTERLDGRERQTEREIRRVTAFLNIVLGNNEVTDSLWSNLNSYSVRNYEVSLFEDKSSKFRNLNPRWLLQSLQYHLKVNLSDSVHECEFFRSPNTLNASDFVGFVSEAVVYNLDFTETFE